VFFVNKNIRQARTGEARKEKSWIAPTLFGGRAVGTTFRFKPLGYEPAI